MVGLLLIGFLMVLTAMLFTYVELLPFLRAWDYEKSRLAGARKALLPLIMLKRLPMLFPAVVDLILMVFMSTYLGFGAGVVGGVTGIFGSNVLSAIIYYHTHVKTKRNQEEDRFYHPIPA